MDWASAIGAGISTIGSIFGIGQQNAANANLNKINREWQAGQNIAQRRWTEEMWNKTNEYNTPSNQMERLRQAGINPFISGSGGYSNVSQVPSAPASQSAPSSVPMGNFGSAISQGVNTYFDAANKSANAANQLSQSLQQGVDTAIAIYEKTGDYDAAQRYLSTVLGSVGGANLSKDSMYFDQFNLAIAGMKLDNINKGLQNFHQTIENELIAKYGDKRASAEIANIEQLTTKFVGELGLMSSEADLNRAKERLTFDQAYELGARAARELSEAGWFSVDASFKKNIANFLIGSAEAAYYQDWMATSEQFSNYRNNTKVRQWKESNSGQYSRLASYSSDPDNNPVFGFARGLTQSLGLSLNGNLNRNFSNSFSRGIYDSRAWNMQTGNYIAP